MFSKISVFFPVLYSADLLKGVIVFIPNLKEGKIKQSLNSGDHDRHRFQIIPDSTLISLLFFSVDFIVKAETM